MKLKDLIGIVSDDTMVSLRTNSDWANGNCSFAEVPFRFWNEEIKKISAVSCEEGVLNIEFEN